MEVSTHSVGDVTVVQVPARMTEDEGVREFGDTVRALLENGQARIVVNCEKVSYIDSAGIGEILKAYAAVCRGGGVAKLVPSRSCCWVCSGMLKLVVVFETFDTEAAAIAAAGR